MCKSSTATHLGRKLSDFPHANSIDFHLVNDITYYQAMLVTPGLEGHKHTAENPKTFEHGALKIASPQETESNQLICLLRYLGIPFYGYILFNSIQ